MTPEHDNAMMQTRRQFLGRTSAGIGSVALASLLNPRLFAGLAGFPNFAPKAKRVIYLFQSGAPSQFELLDHKPALAKAHGQVLGSEFFGGQRLTGMTSGQKEKKICKSIYNFSRHGRAARSERVAAAPRSGGGRALRGALDADAGDQPRPAITFFQTGFQQAGRPSMGAWASYGLGSESADLPAYVVMISQGSAKRDSQALYARLWGSGFLPSEHQGVKFRSSGDPVLYLSNPDGITAKRRRRILDLGQALNREHHERLGDPEILTRIQQAEMAYRMQTSVPELMDTSSEPEHIFDLYGANGAQAGHVCGELSAGPAPGRARRALHPVVPPRLDQHGDLPRDLPLQCGDVDQSSAALIADLKQRGMLDETLVIWGGEFGRTVYAQGGLNMAKYGRDHHPRCFSMWMAGGGIRGGTTYGTTDDFSFNVVENPVHVYDLHATMLHCLGVDHEKLTFKFQGRHYRLTDVHGDVVKGLLA